MEKYSIASTYLEITSACNGKCIYCYNDSGKKQAEYLPNDIIERWITNVMDENPNAGITLSGGEPFLHPGFLKIISFLLEEKNVTPAIITNASLFPQHGLPKMLAQCNYQVTLESLYEQEHDTFRGSGSFRNISLLPSYTQNPGNQVLRINLSRLNYLQWDKMVILAKEFGYKNIRIGFIWPFGRATSSNLQLDSDTKRSLLFEIESMKNSEIAFGINLSTNNCYPRTDCNFTREHTFAPRVSAKGDVFPCSICHAPIFQIGNVYHDNIQTILNSAKFKQLMSNLMARTAYSGDNCSVCIWNKICFKGCPVYAYDRYGTLQHHSGDCEFLKEYFKKKLFDNGGVDIG